MYSVAYNFFFFNKMTLLLLTSPDHYMNHTHTRVLVLPDLASGLVQLKTNVPLSHAYLLQGKLGEKLHPYYSRNANRNCPEIVHIVVLKSLHTPWRICKMLRGIIQNASCFLFILP